MSRSNNNENHQGFGFNSNQTYQMSSINTTTTGNSSSNDDQIFSANAWWRNYGSSMLENDDTMLTSSNGQELNGDSCSVIDWESFFAPSNHPAEPKVTSIPTSQPSQLSCKIVINPNCTSDNSNNTFECNNNYSTTTISNNGSCLDGMINLLNRILIMNGIDASTPCQMPTNPYQYPNLETNTSSFVTETSNFNYAPIQSFDEVASEAQHNTLLNRSFQSNNNYTVSSSSSSDSDSHSHNSSNNSIGKDRSKISKKRTTRPRLKFQKEADKSIKFNLVTSEELAASLLFHETSVPTTKRNRGRPKKSETAASPQKPKSDQSTSIEFMVNCYDQCTKIFK